MNRIKYLDGLRGLAISLVVLFHAYARWPQISYVADTKNFFLFKYGYFGVQLFFMISGFVILMSLENCKSFKEFMYKRWIRLFPAMLFISILIYCTANFFAERPAGIPNIINTLPGFIFISPKLLSIFGLHIGGLEGAFWTLYIEAAFYFISAILYFSCGKKTLYIFMACCLPTTLFIKFFDFIHTYPFLETLFYHIAGFNYYGWFLVGMLSYEYYKAPQKNNYVLYALAPITLVTLANGVGYHPERLLPLILIIFSFISPLFLNKIKKILSNSFLIFLGTISYPLYLVHENMMVSIILKLDNLFLKEVTALSFFYPLLAMPFLLSIAWITATKIEPAIRKQLRKVTTRSDSIAATSCNY